MMAESVALGAAYAAGLSAGYWPDRALLNGHWHRAAEWRSTMAPEERSAQLAGWRKAVELSIEWGRRTTGGG
jgi:glycerol kinase